MGEAPGLGSKHPTRGKSGKSLAAPQGPLPFPKMLSPKAQSRERAFPPHSRAECGSFCPKPKEFYPSVREG